MAPHPILSQPIPLKPDSTMGFKPTNQATKPYKVANIDARFVLAFPNRPRMERDTDGQGAALFVDGDGNATTERQRPGRTKVDRRPIKWDENEQPIEFEEVTRVLDYVPNEPKMKVVKRALEAGEEFDVLDGETITISVNLMGKNGVPVSPQRSDFTALSPGAHKAIRDIILSEIDSWLPDLEADGTL